MVTDKYWFKELNKYNAKRLLHFFGIIFISVCILFLAIWSFLTVENFPGHEGLNSWLLKRLVSTKPLTDDFTNLPAHSRKVIYVLGGAGHSIERRFKTASDLYHNNIAKKIFILSEPGITEYDPSLGRNLTNDEWSIKKLISYGIAKESIVPLRLKPGFFGTLREAREVSREVLSRRYNVLILVSSPYHTMRVRESFSKYLKDKGIDVFVYHSDDYPQLWVLLIEYLKLKIYENILL